MKSAPQPHPQTGAAAPATDRALTGERVDLDARERFLGCLLGGAVGDALGASVEFLSRAQILERHGPQGLTDYAPAYGGPGRITDDTQMSLFTAEGLLRGWVGERVRGVTSLTATTAHAYLRWLTTQGESTGCIPPMADSEPGWLVQQAQLHHRRAPGNTCVRALREMTALGEPAHNDSKGCGGVMRMAPVGLYCWRLQGAQTTGRAFTLGCELAALTHGHPSGYLTGGVLAVLVQALADGRSLTEALATACALLRDHPGHEETLQAIAHAQALAGQALAPEAAIALLGEGWVAEEALAIALYCALVARDFRHGVTLAVNHDGDSDSTGAIAGNLLGTLHGRQAIPAAWLEALELRDVISELAEDLYRFTGWDIGAHAPDAELNARIWRKYPGF
jgi:ADP-ribosylglycohydrolase